MTEAWRDFVGMRSAMQLVDFAWLLENGANSVWTLSSVRGPPTSFCRNAKLRKVYGTPATVDNLASFCGAERSEYIRKDRF